MAMLNKDRVTINGAKSIRSSTLHTVPLKCNVTLARKYFAQISLLNALLSISTRTNSMRVEADVEDSTG